MGTSPPASPSGDNHMFPKRPIKGHLFLMVLIKASSPSSVTKTWGGNVLISCHKLVIEQLLPCRGERRLVLRRLIRFGKNITKIDIHSLCCWKVHLCNIKRNFPWRNSLWRYSISHNGYSRIRSPLLWVVLVCTVYNPPIRETLTRLYQEIACPPFFYLMENVIKSAPGVICFGRKTSQHLFN